MQPQAWWDGSLEACSLLIIRRGKVRSPARYFHSEDAEITGATGAVRELAVIARFGTLVVLSGHLTLATLDVYGQAWTCKPCILYVIDNSYACCPQIVGFLRTCSGTM